MSDLLAGELLASFLIFARILAGPSYCALPCRPRTTPADQVPPTNQSLTHVFPDGHPRLLKKCKKPDKKEFLKVARLTAVGFLAVGFLGFFVKLIFLPINQIVVSSS